MGPATSLSIQTSSSLRYAIDNDFGRGILAVEEATTDDAIQIASNY